MYRVFLVPTHEFAPKELWLDAHAVVETEGGEFWDFVDPEERLVRRLAKSGVKSFEVTPDRRKPRPVQEPVLSDILSSVGDVQPQHLDLLSRYQTGRDGDRSAPNDCGDLAP